MDARLPGLVSLDQWQGTVRSQNWTPDVPLLKSEGGGGRNAGVDFFGVCPYNVRT